jgi:hypothetical protein
VKVSKKDKGCVIALRRAMPGVCKLLQGIKQWQEKYAVTETNGRIL